MAMIDVVDSYGSEFTRLDGRFIAWGDGGCGESGACPLTGRFVVDEVTGDVAFGLDHELDFSGRFGALRHLTLLIMSCAPSELKNAALRLLTIKSEEILERRGLSGSREPAILEVACR
jgi:hypothetical protein